MGFDDLARHMKARDGGKLSPYTDPNLMMVEASERAHASARTSSLVLGPMMLVGGVVLVVLMAMTSVSAEHQGGYVRWGWLWAIASGAVITGATKTLRGMRGAADD